MKIAGRGLLHLGDTALLIRDAFRGDVYDSPEWELPGSVRTVSGELVDPPSVLLRFEHTAEGDSILQTLLVERPGGLRGWHRLHVWLETSDTQPTARVMVTAGGVGQAEVPHKVWQQMLPARREGLYADGLLEARLAHGQPVSGTLMCSYLPAEPA